MTITNELKNLEKVQTRLIRFCKYLDKQERVNPLSNYDSLYIKIGCVIGAIEDALNFDETI